MPQCLSKSVSRNLNIAGILWVSLNDGDDAGAGLALGAGPGGHPHLLLPCILCWKGCEGARRQKQYCFSFKAAFNPKILAPLLLKCRFWKKIIDIKIIGLIKYIIQMYPFYLDTHRAPARGPKCHRGNLDVIGDPINWLFFGQQNSRKLCIMQWNICKFI